MALARCEFDATDEAGNLLSNVSVTVRREGGGLQQVFADRAGTMPLGNPFVVVDGHVGFHAAGGAYRITMTAGDLTRERRWVAIGLAAETDFTLSRPAGGWDDEVAYEIGDLVYHDDYLFISRISANLDNEPDATTPGDTADWMFAGAALEGPTGRGLSYDAQVDLLAGRDAYDDEEEGFSVLVSNVGDGRAAIYVMGDGGSADWASPAYVTGIGVILASSSAPASVQLAEASLNGTNTLSIAAPASITSDKTLTLLDVTGTLLAIAAGSLPVVDNRVPRFDGITGLLQPSLLEIDDNGNFASRARFVGPVSQTAAGIDRIDIGVESGTPRIIMENAGLTTWMVDSDVSGLFRWFTPGVVQMQLAAGSILTLNQATAELNLGNPTDTTITRLAAQEIAVEGKRLVWSTAPVTKTADFTVAANESSFINNKTGSACVATLPSAASFPGRPLMFNNVQALAVNSASSNVVPKAGGSAAAGILPATLGAWALLVSDGTNWKILMSGT